MVVGADRGRAAGRPGRAGRRASRRRTWSRAAALAPARPVFVFPGQGSQWAGMARRAAGRRRRCSRRRIGECAAALAPFVDWSLLDVLRGGDGAPSLDRVDVVQPALFAVMVSLAALWRSYGVRAGRGGRALAGRDRRRAVSPVRCRWRTRARVVALRSQAIGALAGHGGMVSVALPATEVEELLAPYAGRLSVAAVNGPARGGGLRRAGGAGRAAGRLRAGRRPGAAGPVDYASHSAAGRGRSRPSCSRRWPRSPRGPGRCRSTPP